MSEELANPFDDPFRAARYAEWYTGKGRRAGQLEKQLLGKLLRRFPLAKNLLDVGCGTGHFTRWFAGRQLRVVGLDISDAMLAEARRRGGEYVRGDANMLPYAAGEWDLVALITTLEFVSDPERALSEAIRVANQGLLLGVLNRNSLLTLRYRRSGNPMWKSAHFFTLAELREVVRKVAGPRLTEMSWRTTLWPVPWTTDLRLPWGGFIGMAVHLRPYSRCGIPVRSTFP